MLRIGVVVVLVAMLGGCAANMQLGTTPTSRGVIHQANLDLGQVIRWNRSAGTTRSINMIDPALFRVATSPRTDSDIATFTGKANLAGGVTLPDTLRAELETEVANRSRMELRGFRSARIVNPVHAFNQSVRADPAAWYDSLELDRSGPLELPEDVFLVIVTEVTTGEALQITLDRELAAGGTFTSSVMTATGPVRFRVSDARSLEIMSSEGNAAFFARLQIFSTRRGESGIRLVALEDDTAMQQLATAIASGL
jgi:hypothetical protein